MPSTNIFTKARDSEYYFASARAEHTDNAIQACSTTNPKDIHVAVTCGGPSPRNNLTIDDSGVGMSLQNLKGFFIIGSHKAIFSRHAAFGRAPKGRSLPCML